MPDQRDWRSVAAAYDRGAPGYDERHGDDRSRARFAIIERPMLEATRGARRVLELGCGTGRLMTQVRAPMRVGIDVSRAMLERARSRVPHVLAADAHALPFADQSFDAIVAGKGVFRYLDERIAFGECARVLRPGGRLAVHQYAATTWTLRDLMPWRRARPGQDIGQDIGQASGHDISEIDTLDDLYGPARRVGLVPARTHLFRAIRVPPYALAIPAWMPGRWWSHCVVIFAMSSTLPGQARRSGYPARPARP